MSINRIAFFGATGGSANAALVLALKANYNIHALARNPSKLIEQLLKKGISQTTIDTYLEITSGHVRDVEAVKRTLIVQDKPATKILSAVGMADSDLFSWSKTPGHTVCQDAATTIVEALGELDFSNPPQWIAVSGRGNSAGPRDYPLLHIPVYWLITLRPGWDKKAMEKVILTAARDGLVDSYSIVKPAVLTDGTSLGMSKIRAGTEAAPAVGYTISRQDVGLWLWEELLKEPSEKWKNEKISITY